MIHALFAAALAALTQVAYAQGGYPSRPITMVVGFAPGGGTDTVARIVAKKLGDAVGQTVIVENKAGAGGTVATHQVARSAPDGYTILLGSIGSLAVAPHIIAKLPYDPLRDLAPITMAVEFPNVIVVQNALPAKTLAEFVQLAKANPGTIGYGSSGVGGIGHLAGALLAITAGIDIVHIPYKGIPFAVPAAIAGEVQLTFSGIASSQAHVKAGRLKALAIGGPARSPLMPEVPTFAEQGYPEVETHAWFGLFVPAGSPRAAVDRIQRDVAAILNDPAFRDREIVGKGYDLVASTPEAFAVYLVRDREARGRAVKISGARGE